MALIYKPAIFRAFPNVHAALSLAGSGRRPYGFNMSPGVGDDAERVHQNRVRLAEMLGFDADRMAVQQQVHGTAIAAVGGGYTPGETDALVCAEAGWLLAVSVADCIPVLMYDEANEVVAGVHSGWRGTYEQITLNTIRYMSEHYQTRPELLHVYVGASAGQCCYEVGDDVASKFDGRYSRPIGGGKYLFDNRGVVLSQLMSSGVDASRIELDERCTICDGHFHSYRRDGKRSGRMFGVIGISAHAELQN